MPGTKYEKTRRFWKAQQRNDTERTEQMTIKAFGITEKEAKQAEKYIMEYRTKPVFMVPKEMAGITGIHQAKCERILAGLKKGRYLQQHYALYCPECGKLVDRSTLFKGLKMSRNVCPWCKAEVKNIKENRVKIYTPISTDAAIALKDIKIVGIRNRKSGRKDEEKSERQKHDNL